MRKILLSLLTISAVALVAVAATGAFFSDTETSTGNTFEAGSIDLKIDNTSYLNGVLQEGLSWELKDLDGELFFDYQDLKPGDEGEDTVSLHVFENNAWACVDLTITANDDVTCTEPELDDDVDCEEPGEGLGELADELEFIFWVDDGDNVLEDDEEILTQGPASNVLGDVTWTLADSDENNVGGIDGDPLTGSVDYFIGKAWCFGDLTPDATASGQGVSPVVDSGIDCDGAGVDNASQTDLLEGTISFYAEQSKNNPDFQCET
ncbi:hypothetical protein IH980_03675 [Patescibacteria group bacterium]|nr:hypothetical protein [Patescibacteria group bacterium]